MDTITHWYIHSVFLMDVFIQCAIVSPAFGVDTNQKKKHGYHRLDTDWSFTDLFFWYYLANDSWIWLWIYLDLRVLTHSLSWHLVHWFKTKTWINPCMLLRALRLDSCHTGRPYESKLSTVNLHDRNRWRPQSPPRKSIQAINQDKPAAQWNCSVFVIQYRGGIIMAPYTDFSPHLASNPS